MGVGNPDETAVAFDGNWREFLPIALTNFGLTLVTLGFYRFWATTRERQYFWSRTRFIDDYFEWTGKGIELFKAFIAVLVLFGLPFIALQFVMQGLLMQNQGGAFFGLVLLLYLFWFYLAGIAMYRALRYRLSKTYWHGIHGGSDEPGWAYGWSFIWKNVVAYLCMALLFPWSMTALWKERWEHMSFGPHKFESEPQWSSLMGRYIIAYVSPFIAIFGAMILMIPMIIASAGSPGEEPPAAMMGAIVVVVILAIYVLMPLLALIFYSAYMREVISTLRLSTLEFYFGARTKDWIKLFLGNVGLYLLAGAVAAIPIGALGLFSVFTNLEPGHSPFGDNPVGYIGFLILLVIPFGLVTPFVRYRGWAFYIRHMEVGGIIDLATLTQSPTRELKQGEGLLDALDLGAM